MTKLQLKSLIKEVISESNPFDIMIDIDGDEKLLKKMKNLLNSSKYIKNKKIHIESITQGIRLSHMSNSDFLVLIWADMKPGKYLVAIPSVENPDEVTKHVLDLSGAVDLIRKTIETYIP